MKKYVTDPVADLNSHVPGIVKRFDFERPESVVSRSVASAGEDTEIYGGTVVTSFGYFRVARHRPTGALCLLASKSPINLRGERDAQDGSIRATKDGLAHSYIVAAYRASGRDDDTYKVASLLRRSMHLYGEKLGDRCEKHFTLYGANIVNPAPDARGFNTETPTEVWTNGRLAYLVDQNKRGNWEVRFYAPVRRAGGSFVPVSLSSSRLADSFSRVSRVVSASPDYETARAKMAEHWQHISSRLWDEESIYKGEGFWMHAKKQVSDLFNAAATNRYSALALLPFGLVLTVLKPELGLLYAIGYAAAHYIGHEIFSESLRTTYDSYKRARTARGRLDIDSYPEMTDASDHFKIQTRGNIAKLSAKMDIARFEPGEFEFLDSGRSGLLRHHEQASDDFCPNDIDDLIISMHQRGFSSTCVLPDPRTRLDVFQSGLVRLMQQMPDGRVRIYAGYSADSCSLESQRMPAQYADKLAGGIYAIDYDPNAPEFRGAFRSRFIDRKTMMADLESSLLRDWPGVPAAIRDHSLRAAAETFSGVQDMPSSAVTEPVKRHPSLPDLRAMM